MNGRQIQAKAMDVANRHPLNRLVRDKLLAAGESVEDNQLYAVELIGWRLDVVKDLEGRDGYLKAIEALENRVKHLIEIERDPYEAIERFEEEEYERGCPIERLDKIRSRGFEAIKRLVTDEYYQLEANERLEAINWRANRPEWLEWEYQAELMMVALMECTPLSSLRYLLSLEVWDGCCWEMEDYGGIEEWTPEALADSILWELAVSYDYEATRFVDEKMDEKWDKWTTAERFDIPG